MLLRGSGDDFIAYLCGFSCLQGAVPGAEPERERQRFRARGDRIADVLVEDAYLFQEFSTRGAYRREEFPRRHTRFDHERDVFLHRWVGRESVQLLRLGGRGVEEGAQVDLRGAGPLGQPERREEDRKSTRLNSSHVAISYAVFCLK